MREVSYPFVTTGNALKSTVISGSFRNPGQLFCTRIFFGGYNRSGNANLNRDGHEKRRKMDAYADALS